MSARDDVHSESRPATRRPERRAAIVWLVLGGALLGPLLGLALGPRLAANHLPLYEAVVPWQGPPPTPEEGSRPRGRGESAAVRGTGASAVLVARAPTPGGAEALALDLALGRLSRSPELAERRAARHAEWAAALVAGPVIAPSPASACAARLRGWADAWRAVASDGGHGTLERTSRGGSIERERPMAAESEVSRSALARDGEGLALALARESRVARAQLFATIGALPHGRRALAIESWRRGRDQRAAELTILAEALEARMTGTERAIVARAAPGLALEAAVHVPDPAAILLLAASGAEPAVARPVAATWALFAALGAFLAPLVAVPLARFAARVRNARREALMRKLREEADEGLALVPRIEDATDGAWMQLVSGPRPRFVAGVVRELAARAVAHGHRVLVVDGGRSLRLHDSFSARARLGFQECMHEQLPLLGVVQSGGLPGLFVLAHGAPSRIRSWAPLRRLLDQARPHFSRVVLALEPSVSRQAGDALAGRLIEGWWASKGTRGAADARRLAARLGLALRAIEPAAPARATMEALVREYARAAGIEPAAASATAFAAQAPAAHALEPVKATEHAAAVAAPEPEPAEAAHGAATVEASEPEFVEAPEPAAPAVEPVFEAEAAPEYAASAAPALENIEAPGFATPAALVPPELLAVIALADSAVAAERAAVAAEERPGLAFGPPGAQDAPDADPAAAAVEPDHAFADPGAPEPALAAAASSASIPGGQEAAAGTAPQEPVVLEDDAEVRERLRFLIWMRRLHAKKRGETAHVG